ncbi:hypothetical protein FSP39_017061 [Pinctada imbricata]|uniref:Metallo-beta-lactamase domain-containing protein n=1 Tax=Pinctada imbricata TaxID=66713 RepID=A0AA88XFX8_PINIB|nr:hypothetical protein FSP39_017061 [Pinctada imbricata]
MEKKGFIKIGKYHVFPWTISGLESCVVVRSDDLFVVFDMGYSHRETIMCKHVFISHGHMDHIGGLPQHNMKRGLFRLPGATYFLPKHLVEKVSAVASLFHDIHGTDSENMLEEELHLVGVDPGETIEISPKFFAQPFQTHHRVKSQGYLIYKRNKELKPEYRGLEGREIGEKVKSGIDVYQITTSPEIAYTGDTTFEVFQNLPHPDLLKVKLLITESTYIDLDPKTDSIAKARERGHIHVQEIIRNEEFFKDVGAICLTHFSDKYPPSYIDRTLSEILPSSLKDKVFYSTIAKEKS